MLLLAALRSGHFALFCFLTLSWAVPDSFLWQGSPGQLKLKVHVDLQDFLNSDRAFSCAAGLVFPEQGGPLGVDIIN